MGYNDSLYFSRFTVQVFTNIAEDLSAAAGNTRIDHRDAIADKEIAVGVDPVDLVDVRKDLHKFSGKNWHSRGMIIPQKKIPFHDGS